MAFRKSSSNLNKSASFITALRGFDFENADFFDRAVASIGESRNAAQEVLASLEELGSFDYGGVLANLGGYIQEYSDAVAEAVEELLDAYTALEELLQALEPTLREEATITQLEAPQSDAEWLGRLRKLYAALDVSLADLTRVEVPPTLSDYLAYFTDLFSTMHKLIGDIITALNSPAPQPDSESNPDFLHVRALLDDYPPLVEKFYEKFKIFHIDPLVERVELEINRLYLEEED